MRDLILSDLKENVYFSIDNEKNTAEKDNDQKSVFYDDCGVLDSGSVVCTFDFGLIPVLWPFNTF